MKLNMGETRREKRERLENWHPWFAWYPVRMGNSYEGRWLEWVERKGTPIVGLVGHSWSWEYRPVRERE